MFVSIVSTKVPFKGTGKEYIGDDIEEIATAVKGAIMACCNQLKSKITRQLAMRDQAQRKKNLKRYSMLLHPGPVRKMLKQSQQSLC